MARSRLNSSTVQVGFAQCDITPALPFPLAGYGHREERLARSVRDPLTARAAAFADGRHTALVVTTDLLLISVPLREAVADGLRRAGVSFDGLLLTATHTHSSTGGYVDRPSAKLFLGRYREAIFHGIVAGIVEAATAAVADLAPAVLTIGTAEPQHLNWNRRHKEGPVDRTLSVVTARRGRRTLRIISFGAHPVVVAERDHHVASACWPGELCKTFEAQGDQAMFVVGPVGGVNVFFPEGPLPLEVHLALLTRLLREEADRALAAAEPVDLRGGVAFGLGEMPVAVVAPRLFPDHKAWLDLVAMPLRLYARHFGRGALLEGEYTQVPIVRVGELIFTGFPADLGAGVGLAARTLIAGAGLRTAVVASQTGDYIGYVHLPDDYERYEEKDKVARGMTIYENALGLTGRDTGLRLLEAFRRGLASVERN